MIMIQIFLPTQIVNYLSQHKVFTVLCLFMNLKCLYYYHILNSDIYSDVIKDPILFICLFFRTSYIF